LIKGRIKRALNDIPEPVVMFFAMDILILVVYLLDGLVGAPFGSYFSFFVDLDKESNMPTWYSSTKLFLVGYLLLSNVKAPFTSRVKVAPAILILAAIFLLMSLDEMIGIHEFIGRASDVLLPGQGRSSSIFPVTGIWMFIVLPPALIAMFLLLRKLRNAGLSASIYRLLVTGLVIYMLSAGGIEILSNYSGSGILALMQIAAEEFGEMIGTPIMFWAAYELCPENTPAMEDS
jgi:hypothetical protein